MNFMFLTTLDAAGDVIRVHYKSMKCDVSFSHGSVGTILSEANMFHTCVKISSCLHSAKIIKIDQHFSQL